MIQRIQTIYLLIILILMGQTFLLPFISFFNEEETISFTALQFDTGEYILPLAILVGVILLFTFVAIFLFKSRLRQIRLTFFVLLLLLGTLVLIGYYTWHLTENRFLGYEIKYNFTCIYPFVGSIFAWLAIRGMKKDEALVRSVNRIR